MHNGYNDDNLDQISSKALDVVINEVSIIVQKPSLLTHFELGTVEHSRADALRYGKPI